MSDFRLQTIDCAPNRTFQYVYHHIMKTLIIEDEQPAARQLAKLLGRLETPLIPMEVLDSVESAVKWLCAFPAPELIFMDIQIADGLSFDIFAQVEVVSPVIFTTAFDHYAVQAFRVNAVDYLLKPVDPEELARAVARVRERKTAAPFNFESLSRYFKTEAYKDRFLIKTGQQLGFLLASDIAFFRSSEGLTQAFTLQGKKHFVEHTLEELERLLDPKDFFRISRGVTLRLNSIKAVHPHFNGRLKVDTQPAVPEETFVSRERVGEFKAWLGG
jgi:DNA-binding LytR/AlgR family response regulator